MDAFVDVLLRCWRFRAFLTFCLLSLAEAHGKPYDKYQSVLHSSGMQRLREDEPARCKADKPPSRQCIRAAWPATALSDTVSRQYFAAGLFILRPAADMLLTGWRRAMKRGHLMKLFFNASHRRCRQGERPTDYSMAAEADADAGSDFSDSRRTYSQLAAALM